MKFELPKLSKSNWCLLYTNWVKPQKVWIEDHWCGIEVHTKTGIVAEFRLKKTARQFCRLNQLKEIEV